MISRYSFQVGHMVLFPIPANEDTVLHAIRVWNIGRVADFLESMNAAMLCIATGNAHYKAPHTD